MRLESVPARPTYIDPYPLDEPRWHADSGGPLMIAPLLGIGRADIKHGATLYLALRSIVPFADQEPGRDGRRPDAAHRAWLARRPRAFQAGMVRAHRQLQRSGRYRDDLDTQGIDRILEDSFGNGGAAIAAYAAAGGMRAKILVPAYTQTGKTVQMRAYGADAHLAVLAGAALGCSRSHEGGK